MIAASVWSLIIPSMNLSEEIGINPIIPCVIGISLGVLTLVFTDRYLSKKEEEKIKNKNSILLVLAITLHNIPEGLAIGVAFGAVASNIPGATVGSAIALAIGIGLQNFPEGLAVSVPLRKNGMSRIKSFFIGQSSGMVEPIAGVIGALLVIHLRGVLPYALTFAAGAMIYVVVNEIIPEGVKDSKLKPFVTYGFTIGFIVMMTLDVILG